MKISVILPTHCEEKMLFPLLGKLEKQTMPPYEILILNSSSQEKLEGISKKDGCTVYRIQPKDFSHGGTRNFGAKKARGEILVFMSQDAFPENEHFLAELTLPFQKKNMGAVFARQIPHKKANPLETFARNFNYSEKSYTKNKKNLGDFGGKAYFFSNVASAIHREIFWKLGGFSEQVIVNEDMNFCARLLQNEYSVAYQANAHVIHSHHYNLLKTGRRYFDIGVFFCQSKSVMENIPLSKEGMQFATSQILELLQKKKIQWIFLSLLESVVKYISFKMGQKYFLLPKTIRNFWSMHPSFWVRSKREVEKNNQKESCEI